MTSVNEHGGFNTVYFERMGTPYDPALDFSVNVNPWGPHISVRRAIQDVRYDAYPDPGNLGVRRRLAEYLGLSAEQVLVDAGSSRLMWTIARRFLHRASVALMVTPTFGEFARAVRATGAALTTFSRVDGDRWSLDLHALSVAITRTNAAVVYLCDPNNPTGELLPNGFVHALATQHPDTVFLWDCAYRHLVDHVVPNASPGRPNVIVLQSLTKEQGIPGLRIGYALASGDIVDSLVQERPAWCCGTAEEAAIMAAVEARSTLTETCIRWIAERDRMVDVARQQGFRVQLADAPWFLLRDVDAVGLRDAAVRTHGLLMRCCDSFGIANSLRVCPRTEEANVVWKAWVSSVS